MTDTEPVSGTVHLLMAFLCWMRESYFRHGPVSLSSSPDITDLWVTCRIFVPQNIFTILRVRGRVSVSRFPRANVGGDARVRGCNFLNIGERSWDWDQCGNVCLHIGVVSVEGGGSITALIVTSQLTPFSPLSSLQERIILYYHHHHYPSSLIARPHQSSEG